MTSVVHLIKPGSDYTYCGKHYQSVRSTCFKGNATCKNCLSKSKKVS